MMTESQRTQQLKEAPQAEAFFLDLMNAINNPNSSYETKALSASGFAVMYPLWPHYAARISDALESQNPAYQGMEKHVFVKSGLTFYANRQYAEVETAITHLRQELWINTATGISHVLEYSVIGDSNSIVLDGECLAKATGHPMRELYEYGMTALRAVAA